MSILLMSIFAMLFLSTPSGWRATNAEIERFESYMISIHALRVEGDFEGDGEPEAEETISIHALRVEGDSMSPSTTGIVPGFLSTPSGWRATFKSFYCSRFALCISIHALRVEGDVKAGGTGLRSRNFYPRPPGGGRPAK